MNNQEMADRIEAEAQSLSGLAAEMRQGQLLRAGGESVLLVAPGDDEDNTIAVGSYLAGIRDELEQISDDIYRATAPEA